MNTPLSAPPSTARQDTPATTPDAGPETHITRRGVLIAAGLVLIGSIAIQFSSFAAAQTFADLGTPAASSGRMLIAALVLLIAFRPKISHLTRHDWAGIAIYGASMAFMNLCLFAAVERMPLGIAVTIEFLGPCAVALLASRRIREALCALMALGGVALIAGPTGGAPFIGIVCALGAACSFAVYTVFAEKVGKSNGGMGNLALAVIFAALILLPFGVAKAPMIGANHLAWLAVSAVCGAVIGYGMDTLAAAVTSGRVIGTLFAIDPVMGSLIGWAVMGQIISTSAMAGIVLVAVSGALLVWISGGSAPLGAPNTTETLTSSRISQTMDN